LTADAGPEAVDAVRIEEDLLMLGSREVPDTAYYGIHTVRAVENFQISHQCIGDLPGLIRGMVMVKKAAALANRQLHVLPADVATAIIATCDDLLSGKHLDQFPVDVFQGGAGTSVNMNVNEVIANMALEHLGLAKGRYDVINPNDHVNKSQSTNDAYPTGLRLAAHEGHGSTGRRRRGAGHGLRDQGQGVLPGHQDGRTQLQDAVPMTLGQEFQGFAVM